MIINTNNVLIAFELLHRPSWVRSPRGATSIIAQCIIHILLPLKQLISIIIITIWLAWVLSPPRSDRNHIITCIYFYVKYKNINNTRRIMPIMGSADLRWRTTKSLHAQKNPTHREKHAAPREWETNGNPKPNGKRENNRERNIGNGITKTHCCEITEKALRGQKANEHLVPDLFPGNC